MTTTTEDMNWIADLQRVGMPIELLVLALRTLGMSADVIGPLLSRDPLDIDELAGKALTQCADARLKVPDEDCDFSIKPFGKEAIKDLLKAGDLPVDEKSFTFKWAPTDKVYDKKTFVDLIKAGDFPVEDKSDTFKRDPTDKVFLSVSGSNEETEPILESARSEFHLETEPDFFDWFGEVRKLFLARESRTELFVMLPLPMTDAFRWTILRPQRALSGRDDALRLITSLSALGLGYGDSGHRTKLISNLVLRCQMLFNEIGVGGATYPKTPEYELLRLQANGLAKNALFLRRDESKQGRDSRAQVFAADFSSAWQGNPNRFDCWFIRDRAKDADQMADALLWLMTQTSGICLQLSLPPRQIDITEHHVQVLVPWPWCDFLRQGHGAQRRKKKVFDPYLHVEGGEGALYHVDEPLRYAQLKQSKASRQNKKIILCEAEVVFSSIESGSRRALRITTQTKKI